MKSKIPPLGVMPREIWEEKRLDDLRAAICRFLEADWPIPEEIVSEFNEYVSKKSE